MKKFINYIQTEDFCQAVTLSLLTFACFACLFCLCNNPTASRPKPSQQHIDNNLKGITIQTPAGYTASEAIKNGKVLEIVWK